MVDWIDTKGGYAYVEGPFSRADVHTVHRSGRAAAYIKTEPNRDGTDNLLALAVVISRTPGRVHDAQGFLTACGDARGSDQATAATEETASAAHSSTSPPDRVSNSPTPGTARSRSDQCTRIHRHGIQRLWIDGHGTYGVGGVPAPSKSPVSPATREFGLRVLARRTELGLSQEKAAERCGLHWTYLGQVERGRRNLTLHNILKIAAGLDTVPGELVDGLEVPTD